jgi:hypothetical protein
MEHQHSYDELHHASVDRLREIAEGLEHEAVQGYTQMNKDHLLAALCTALNLDMHAHHEVVGLDKRAVKDQIKQLKVQRDAAIQARDHAQLKEVRRKIHRCKRELHRATV